MAFDNSCPLGDFRNPFDMANIESIRAIRPSKIDTDVPNFSSFSSSTSNCPSLATSFLSTVSSPLSGENGRRLSIDSADSFGIDTFSPHYASGTVSPTTPLTSSDLLDSGLSSANSMMCMPADMNMSQLYPYNENTDLFWMSQEPKQMNCVSPMEYDGQHHLGNGHMRSYFPNQSHLPDSTLSRPIFQSSHASDDVSFPWTPVHSTPPQTVAPSATFQPALSSPHGYSLGPATPSPLRYHAPSTPTLKSSPYSPSYSPSSSYTSSISSAHHAGEALRHIIDARGPMTPCRSSSKKLPRRQESYKVTKSKSFSYAPAYIESNKFKCEYEDCKDKQGKRKAFKRSEHLKRHMNTCHSGKREHVCWVDGCKKPFSRSDNLSTHLKQTHGRKSNGQRNRYVATLDDASPYYDPDYKGPLDNEGRPLKVKAERNE